MKKILIFYSLLISRFKNEMTYIKHNRKLQLVLLVFFVAIIALTVYGANKVNDLRSKADEQEQDAFTVTDESGNTLEYEGNNTYKTDSGKVQLKIKDIEKLIQ